jgi:hypothetical protein
MRARQLIDGAAFGPDALKAIGQAFDAAWQEIVANFGNDPEDQHEQEEAHSQRQAAQDVRGLGHSIWSYRGAVAWDWRVM